MTYAALSRLAATRQALQQYTASARAMNHAAHCGHSCTVPRTISPGRRSVRIFVGLRGMSLGIHHKEGGGVNLDQCGGGAKVFNILAAAVANLINALCHAVGKHGKKAFNVVKVDFGAGGYVRVGHRLSPLDVTNIAAYRAHFKGFVRDNLIYFAQGRAA